MRPSTFYRNSINAHHRLVAASTTPAVDAATQAANASIASTLSWTHTTGSGLANAALLVAVGSSQSNSNNPSVTSVTYGASSLTHLTNMPVASQLGGTERFLDIWYLLSPPAGAASITVTMAAAEFIAAGSVSFQNVNQSSPFSAPITTASIATNNPSTTVTSTVSTDVVFSAVSARTTSAPTGGAGQTQQFSSLSSTNLYLVGTVQSSTGGNVSSSFSWTTADNAAMASFALHGA